MVNFTQEKVPKYLIKFIKEDYLQYFLTQGLYMNAAAYYAVMEKHNKQADKYEGIATSSHLMYKNRNRPVWCCTAIKEDSIKTNSIKIDKRLFEDFFDNDLEKGYIVLFEYKSFIEYFLANKDEYRSVYGCINYLPYKNFKNCFISDDWSDCIFRKDISYSYQTEFRISIDKPCEEIVGEIEIEGKTYETLKSYKAYLFPLPNLSNISKVYKATELYYDGNDYFLRL